VLPHHPLHRQVRLRAVDPRIVETGDVRMLEAGEDVALPGEALRHVPAAGVEERQLQGHVPAERSVVTPGEPHLSHPAAPEELHQHVGPHPVAGEVRPGGGEHR